MQVGVITIGGRQVGVVSQNFDGRTDDDFVPDLDGYVPMGRADAGSAGGVPIGGAHQFSGGGRHHQHHHHVETAEEHKHNSIRYGHHHREGEGYKPKGETYSGGGGHPFSQGSAETDQAIQEAARAHNLDVNTLRSIASIESSMNPSSNANRSTQYKGLFQIGRDEWRRFGGGGNIYSARDNAMGAARMFEANRNQFRSRYHRDPTDTELYMMHQQGLGFYTRGAMTNIGGNPYPGMRGPQTHESFEAGWGREVARRKAGFAASHPAPSTATNPGPASNPGPGGSADKPQTLPPVTVSPEDL
jgi:hypothetical protein